MNDMLDGRVALITGGGSGIGKGAAQALVKAGARVAILGRTEEELREVRDEIAKEGGECEYFLADVSKADELKRAIDEAAARWSRLDIVVANAGVNGTWAPLEELTEEDFEETMGINLKGTFLTIKFSAPYLTKQSSGAVVVVSSVNGNRIFSNTGATLYSASKAGQVAMAKMLAIELGRKNIRVNAVCPGAIKTAIGDNTDSKDTETIKQPAEFPEGVIPLPGRKSGTIEQVGRLIHFLVSDAADHINGEVVFIDGGQSLVQG